MGGRSIIRLPWSRECAREGHSIHNAFLAMIRLFSFHVHRHAGFRSVAPANHSCLPTLSQASSTLFAGAHPSRFWGGLDDDRLKSCGVPALRAKNSTRAPYDSTPPRGCVPRRFSSDTFRRARRPRGFSSAFQWKGPHRLVRMESALHGEAARRQALRGLEGAAQ